MITIKINKNGNIKEYDFPMDWKNPKNNTTFLIRCHGLKTSLEKVSVYLWSMAYLTVY